MGIQTDKNCPINGQHLLMLVNLIRQKTLTIRLKIEKQLANGTENYESVLLDFAEISRDANEGPGWHPTDDQPEEEAEEAAED